MGFPGRGWHLAQAHPTTNLACLGHDIVYRVWLDPTMKYTCTPILRRLLVAGWVVCYMTLIYCMGVARTGGVWSQYLGMAGCEVAGICPTGQINRIGVYKPGGDEKHQLRYPQKLAMLFSRSAVAPLFSRPNDALNSRTNVSVALYD